MKYSFLFIGSVFALFSFNTLLSDVEKLYENEKYAEVADTLTFLIDSLDRTEEELFLDIAHALYQSDTSYEYSELAYDRITDSNNVLKSVALLQRGNLYAFNDLKVKERSLQDFMQDPTLKEKLDTNLIYYKEALLQDYTNDEARYNYELMKRALMFLENQNQQNQDQDGDDQQKDDGDKEDNKDKEDKKDGDQKDKDQEGDQQKDKEGQDSEDKKDGKDGKDSKDKEGDDSKEGKDESSSEQKDQEQEGKDGEKSKEGEQKDKADEAGKEGSQDAEQKSGEEHKQEGFQQGQLSDKQKEELRNAQVKANLKKLKMTPEEAEKIFKQYQSVQKEYYNEKKKIDGNQQQKSGGNDW